jgi:hypothetical protein
MRKKIYFRSGRNQSSDDLQVSDNANAVFKSFKKKGSNGVSKSKMGVISVVVPYVANFKFKKRSLRKTFYYSSGLKTCLLVFLTFTFFTSVGCEKERSQTGQTVNQDSIISNNLIKGGDTISANLIGEWECFKFAYTNDGITIVDRNLFPKGVVEIPNLQNLSLFYTNEIHYDCSISNNNLIKLMRNGSTYILSLDEEDSIDSALVNAYSYALKNGELIIYFTEDTNKNLLILKK